MLSEAIDKENKNNRDRINRNITLNSKLNEKDPEVGEYDELEMDYHIQHVIALPTFNEYKLETIREIVESTIDITRSKHSTRFG